jgi:hypothetical protein
MYLKVVSIKCILWLHGYTTTHPELLQTM